MCSAFTAVLLTAGCTSSPKSPETAAPAAAPLSGAQLASKYSGMLVRRPGDSPDDGKVYLVKDSQKRWILHSEWIQAHGYSWPSSVHEIPASELAAIPEGPPLTDMQ